MAKASIMIVEDESIVAEDMRFSLEANGYDVCGVFASGEEALARAGRLQPDLAMMDIHLQGSLDGTETARLLWDRYGIPVIYLTAYSDHNTLARAKWTRPHAYLLKPFQEHELCITIEIALSNRPRAPLLEVPQLAAYPALQLALAENALPPDRALELGAGWHIRRGPSVAGEPDSFDDRSVDLLDTILALWLQQADTATDQIGLSADSFLALRGLKQQKSGSGARAGYEEKWRREIANGLEALSRLSLGSDHAEKPLLDISPGESPYSWQLRPGAVIAAAALAEPRRTVLFSKRILEYDPYRQKWEKRLARRLSWLWATGAASPETVTDLLTALAVPIDHKNPLRTKERLELALDTLRNDGLTGPWNYPSADPGIIGRRGWLTQWMQWNLQIDAPPAQAPGIAPDAPPRPQTSAEHQRSFAFLKHIRADRGLTQTELASAIGLTQAQLSHIEAGAKVHQATIDKIKTWMQDQL